MDATRIERATGALLALACFLAVGYWWGGLHLVVAGLGCAALSVGVALAGRRRRRSPAMTVPMAFGITYGGSASTTHALVVASLVATALVLVDQARARWGRWRSPEPGTAIAWTTDSGSTTSR